MINLSYCSPVATLFKATFTDRAGWVRAVKTELTRQRAKRPHPQAGRACNWAITWLGEPIDITEPGDLGEAASIHALSTAGTGRLISDDHGARATARSTKHKVRASSTIGVLAALLAPNDVDPATVDTYLDTLRAHGRMRIGLTAMDVLAGEPGPWA